MTQTRSGASLVTARHQLGRAVVVVVSGADVPVVGVLVVGVLVGGALVLVVVTGRAVVEEAAVAGGGAEVVRATPGPPAVLHPIANRQNALPATQSRSSGR